MINKDVGFSTTTVIFLQIFAFQYSFPKITDIEFFMYTKLAQCI